LANAAQRAFHVCTIQIGSGCHAVADFSGGGARGFGVACLVVAALMLVMLIVPPGLRHDGQPAAKSVSSSR